MKKMYLSKDGVTLKRVTKNSEGAIVVPEGVIYLAKRALAGCEYITEVSLPSTLKGLGEEAFEGCLSLSKITIPEGVDTIPKRAFAGCECLESVDLPSSLIRIDKEAFEDCEELTSIVIPEGVTYIGVRAFNNCDFLEEAVIPFSLCEIGNEAFMYCSMLKYISLPEGVTTIPEGCFKCAGLKEFVFPDSVKTIEKEAFYGTNLNEITIGSNVETIGAKAFYLFNSFTVWTLNIGPSVRQIGEKAFWNNKIDTITVDQDNDIYTDAGCNVIMETKTGRVIYGSECSTIPETATAIAHLAFCFSTPKVLVIPGSVKTIEANAFCGCKKCKFILEEGVEVIETLAFDEYNPCFNIVYIPSSIKRIGGQFSSVEFHLDAASKHFRYDKDGQNIISSEGELVWGRILHGIPDGVARISAMFNISIADSELIIPPMVSLIYLNTLRYSTGVRKVQLYGGTKTDAPDSTEFCCELKVLTLLKESSSGITEYIQYNIPKGTSKTDIESALGCYSIFR